MCVYRCAIGSSRQSETKHKAVKGNVLEMERLVLVTPSQKARIVADRRETVLKNHFKSTPFKNSHFLKVC